MASEELSSGPAEQMLPELDMYASGSKFQHNTWSIAWFTSQCSVSAPPMSCHWTEL